MSGIASISGRLGNYCFLAQKDSPLGKKTFKAYLWQVCGDAYDAEHPRN